MSTFYNLTTQAGYKLKVNVDHIDSFGPHVDGGSFVNINGTTIRVKEDVPQLWANKEQI